MKEITNHIIKRTLIIFSIIIVFSCSNDDSNHIIQYDLETDKNILIDNGKCLHIKDKEYEICFISVSDSRCPSGGVCVWAGDAAVKFNFKNSSENKFFTLHTHESFQQDTIINNLHIELINVFPYPELHSSINQNDYSVELIISEQ